MFQTTVTEEEYDLNDLNRQLDRLKTHVFMGNTAAFLGSLLCYVEFRWTDMGGEIPTAAVDGTHFYWSPAFFNYLKPEPKKTVLMHELWHIASLHMLRRGNRDPEIWNWACDININNRLEKEGYSFEGIEDCWKDPIYGEQSPEEIYDDLVLKNLKPPCGNPFGATGQATYSPNGPPQPGGDLKPGTAAQKQASVNAVVQAAHSARASKQTGSIPGDIESLINKFLAPVIAWEPLLFRFFHELSEMDYTWEIRDRRYQDIYLPGETTEMGALDHLAYYFDVSGSVTDAQGVRFNSEFKYIKETFNPKLLTLVQFDTRITQEKIFREEDPFDEIVIIGRGGTSLVPVRDHIIKNKPTAAIIFSDLYCSPMEKLPVDIPVIWVAIANMDAKVAFGEIIHIKA